MGGSRGQGRCLGLLAAFRAALAGPGGARPPAGVLSYELPVDLEEPGDQLVIDEGTGGLAYVKVRPLPVEAGPFFWASGDEAPNPSQASSSWEPWSPGAGAPAPSPSRAGEAADSERSEHPSLASSAPSPTPSPSPAPAPKEQKPAEGGQATETPFWHSLLKEREGWPPLKFETWEAYAEREATLDVEQAKWAAKPLRAVFHEEKAKKAAAYSGKHYCPGSRGGVEGEAAFSSHVAPVSSPENLVWTWHHKVHKWATIMSGVSIDDRLNIYATAFDGVRKFDLSGHLLWEWISLPSHSTDSPFLYKGGLYGILDTGEAYALDIEDGKPIWITKVTYANSQDDGFVQVSDDVVVCGADSRIADFSGSTNVVGLAAETGMQLWRFAPDDAVWNFGAGFPRNGTCLFQDFCGKAYRISMKDGSLIWKTGGFQYSWTDGTATLGPDNVFYTVANSGGTGNAGQGWVTALRVEDGSLVWNAKVPFPPNNAPAIGPLEPGGPNRVVQAGGQQCETDNPTYIFILDAKDGAVLYKFCAPMLRRREPDVYSFQAADPQGQGMRYSCGVRPQSAPNPWGTPTVGADGTIYAGNQDGQFYSIRLTDKPACNPFRYNGNWHGVVAAGRDKALEVWAWDCFACFGGPSGAAIAPGVLVVASIDTMFVFLDPSLQVKRD